jgi:hypothetical protein
LGQPLLSLEPTVHRIPAIQAAYHRRITATAALLEVRSHDISLRLTATVKRKKLSALPKLRRELVENQEEFALKKGTGRMI